MYQLIHTTTGAVMHRGTRRECVAYERQILNTWPGAKLHMRNIGHGYVSGALRRAQRNITAQWGRRSQAGLAYRT